MGVNYYLKKKTNEPWQIPIQGCGDIIERACLKESIEGKDILTCDLSKCVTFTNLLHIGKDSFGWHFSLCIYPLLGIYNLTDWEKLFESADYFIIDEENHTISTEEMIDIITDRKSVAYLKYGDEYEKHLEEGFKEQGYESYQDALDKNHANRGLNGLWAHTSYIWDQRVDENWKQFQPIVFINIRTDGTYDLTTNWNFS